MKVLISILLIFLASNFAQAHSWYDISCCSGDDCEKLPVEGFTDRGDQIEIHYSSPKHGEVHEFFSRKDMKPSKDGQHHICFQPPQAVTGKRVRCIYEPVSG